MSNHTPGPWRHLGGSNAGRVVAGNEVVAFVQGVSRGGRGHSSRRGAVANARLVAASPDLLSAAKRLLESAVIKDAPFSSYSEAIVDLKAAVKKAEGPGK